MVIIAAAIEIIALIAFVLIATLYVGDLRERRRLKAMDEMLSAIPLSFEVEDGCPSEEEEGGRNENGRRHYRVYPLCEGDLSVEVATAEGKPVPARLVDISFGGMGILAGPELGEELQAGDTLYAHIASPYMQEPVVTPSKVFRSAPTDAGFIYGVQFMDRLGLLSKLPEEIRPLFNRRQDPRFEIRTKSPIKVRVHCDAPSFELKADLRDISLGGISFAIDAEEDSPIAEAVLIRVSFRLPNKTETLSFAAVTRPAIVVDGRMYIGAFFDKERTEEYDAKRRLLMRYLEELQKEKVA